MKNFLPVLLFLLFTAFAVDAEERNYPFSFIAGPTFSYVVSGSNTTGVMVGAQAGFLMRSNIDKPAFCQLGLLFSYQGGIDKEEAYLSDVKIAKTQLGIGYVKVPVSFNYRIPLQDGVTLTPMAGLYGGMLLFSGMRFKMQRAGGGSWSESIDVNENIRKFDLGLRLGAAVDIRRFRVGFSYDYGMTDISEAGADMHNRVISLDLGVNF